MRRFLGCWQPCGGPSTSASPFTDSQRTRDLLSRDDSAKSQEAIARQIRRVKSLGGTDKLLARPSGQLTVLGGSDLACSSAVQTTPAHGGMLRSASAALLAAPTSNGLGQLSLDARLGRCPSSTQPQQPPGKDRILNPCLAKRGHSTQALTSLARLSSRAGLGLTHEQLISSDRRPSSLLEASARRLALAKHRSEAALNSSAQSIPQQFIDAYMEAVKAGDAQWASAALVSGLFAEQAKMVTQDKQTYHGKPAVVRRLNKGMETLLRMAGQEAADAAPDFTVEGPSETASGTWLVTYIFKRGMAKYRVVNEFTIVAGEITHLRSSRA